MNRIAGLPQGAAGVERRPATAHALVLDAVDHLGGRFAPPPPPPPWWFWFWFWFWFGFHWFWLWIEDGAAARGGEASVAVARVATSAAPANGRVECPRPLQNDRDRFQRRSPVAASCCWRSCCCCCCRCRCLTWFSASAARWAAAILKSSSFSRRSCCRPAVGRCRRRSNSASASSSSAAAAASPLLFARPWRLFPNAAAPPAPPILAPVSLRCCCCCCFASLGPGGCFFLRPLLLFQPSIFCFLLQHSAVVFLFCLFLLPPGFFRCCGFGSSRILCFFLQLLLLLSCRISPLVPCHVLPGRALDKHCSRRALLLLQQQQQRLAAAPALYCRKQHAMTTLIALPAPSGHARWSAPLLFSLLLDGKALVGPALYWRKQQVSSPLHRSRSCWAAQQQPQQPQPQPQPQQQQQQRRPRPLLVPFPFPRPFLFCFFLLPPRRRRRGRPSRGRTARRAQWLPLRSA